MKSAFITSSGDPYVLLNCLHYYETVWQDEVDELWIALNTTMEREVMVELIKRFPKGVKFFYTNQRLGYGTPINHVLDMSPEGKVLLLEDDSIFFKKGVVTKYFDLLDEYKLIASPRMSCPKSTADYAKKKFGLNYEGWGDKGCSFWPCFLWIDKSLLLSTDRNFNPTKWGDTFVSTSLQLRELIGDQSKILEIPQYHCSPDDFQNKEQGLGIFDGECGYMHLGSLSSGIESYLLDEDQVPLCDREAGIKAINPKPIENTPEMQKRMMWLWNCFDRSRGMMPEWFEEIYYKSWKRAVEKAGITEESMTSWRNLYFEHFDWPRGRKVK